MKKILLIEDDLMLRQAYEAIFSKADFEVSVAEDGVRGIEKALEQKPDVILLDLLMPNMNGIQFLEQWQLLDAEKKTKIIVASNSGVPEMIERAKELGAKIYMQKAEVSPKDILAAVNKELES